MTPSTGKKFKRTLTSMRLKWPTCDPQKFFLFAQLRKHWSLIPLVALNCLIFTAIPLFAWHRTFVTTIDVQLGNYQRWEIPTVPRFFDLRNPRNLKQRARADPVSRNLDATTNGTYTAFPFSLVFEATT
ncbi:uncharacterized protein LOC107269499 isoform X2 [Cephus cinctus]|uniref:Uncharacterized protein LOC107269499 isoform X2 n=1 Tax=Cephus cinctus TaxID=211228 RepID=A0AAJ7RL86_CEPCN|nr:uncharacterized protein LOC107269499 isoform X2 [Cephus cinctus]